MSIRPTNEFLKEIVKPTAKPVPQQSGPYFTQDATDRRFNRVLPTPLQVGQAPLGFALGLPTINMY